MNVTKEAMKSISNSQRFLGNPDFFACSNELNEYLTKTYGICTDSNIVEAHPFRFWFNWSSQTWGVQ